MHERRTYRPRFYILIGMSIWALIATGAHPAKAQLIAKETFDYAAPGTIVGQGQAAQGWGGAWIQTSGTAAGQVMNDSILNIEMAIRPALPIAELSSGSNHRLERPLAAKALLSEGPVWVSFISESVVANNQNSGSLSLMDYSFDTTEAVRLQFGKTWGSLQLVVDGYGYYPRATGHSYPFGQWMVAQIIPAGNGRASVYTWVNPEPDMLPDTAMAQVRNRPANMSGIDALQLSAQDEAGMFWRVDDIYLGRDFESVVPPDWVPIDPEIIDRRASEPFEYQPGEGISGAAGGSGFLGPWVLLNSFDHAIADSTLSFGQQLETQAPLARLVHDANNTNARYIRRLLQPFPDDGNTYWMGVVMQTNYTADGNVAQVFLGNIDELGPGGPPGQYLQIGKAFQDDRFSLGLPNNFVYANSIPATGTYWMVVRIRTSGDAGPEQADLWVNPDPALAEPTSDDIELSIQLPINSGWNALGFKVEGEAGIAMLLDDLAVGSSYRHVVPPYLITATSTPGPLSGFRLFPNPGNGLVRVEFNEPGNAMLAVFSMDGKQLVDTEVISGQEVELLPLSSPPGPYVLRIIHSGGVFTQIYLKL